jgi:hypothetical protein
MSSASPRVRLAPRRPNSRAVLPPHGPQRSSHFPTKHARHTHTALGPRAHCASCATAHEHPALGWFCAPRRPHPHAPTAHARAPAAPAAPPTAPPTHTRSHVAKHAATRILALAQSPSLADIASLSPACCPPRSAAALGQAPGVGVIVAVIERLDALEALAARQLVGVGGPARRGATAGAHPSAHSLRRKTAFTPPTLPLICAHEGPSTAVKSLGRSRARAAPCCPARTPQSRAPPPSLPPPPRSCPPLPTHLKNRGASSGSQRGSMANTSRIYSLVVRMSSW